MKYFRVIVGSLSILTSASALAQSEPVDKNVGGPYVGGLFQIGQASSSGASSPGPAWLGSLDLGVGLKRDTWNRIELGVELGKGSLSFENKDKNIDATVSLDLSAVAKAGYGYSLGDHAFGVFRVGVGIAQASFKGAHDTGLVTLVGWDAVFPATDTIDVSAGFSWRSLQLKFADLGDHGVQYNVPTLALGARVRL